MDTQKIKAQLNELLEIVEQIENDKEDKQRFMINWDQLGCHNRSDLAQIANDYTKKIKANKKRYINLISEL